LVIFVIESKLEFISVEMAINAEAMKVKLISATNEWFFPNSESC